MKNKKLLKILFNIFMIIIIGNKLKLLHAYSVEVNNLGSFKDYLEKSEDSTITLTRAIQAIDREKMTNVKYHLNSASPNTGDINVAAIIILSIIFVAGIIYAIKQYKKK